MRHGRGTRRFARLWQSPRTTRLSAPHRYVGSLSRFVCLGRAPAARALFVAARTSARMRRSTATACRFRTFVLQPILSAPCACSHGRLVSCMPAACRHFQARSGTITPAVNTGCISCASGDGGPIWFAHSRTRSPTHAPTHARAYTVSFAHTCVRKGGPGAQ